MYLFDEYLDCDDLFKQIGIVDENFVLVDFEPLNNVSWLQIISKIMLNISGL